MTTIHMLWLNYISLYQIAKRLPTFGVDFHPAIDHENIQLQLGVMASGIVVYLKENKINSFSW